MVSGTVKWRNSTKDFGFSQPEYGEKDVFLHISVVELTGVDRIEESQAMTFDIESVRGGREAVTNLALA